jgi:hypothetical protein
MAKLASTVHERRMIGSPVRQASFCARALRSGRVFGALSFLLLLLQLGLVGSAVDASRRAQFDDLGAQASHGVATQTCRAPSHSGEAPAERGAHPDCCLVCQSSARGDAALIAPIAVSTSHAPPHAAVAPRLAAPPMRRPIGWTSSWSSRAPPLVA